MPGPRPPRPRERYRFGLYELETEAAELRRDGRRVPLQDLPFRLLEELLRHPGALRSRDQLRDALWPPDVHVDFDGSLNAAVRRVREALGDAAKDPRFLETVPRRGYRFIAPVEVIDPAPTAQETPQETPEPTPSPRGRRTSLQFAVVVAVLAAVAVFWAVGPRSTTPQPGLVDPAPSSPMRVAVLPLEVIGSDERLGPIAAGLTDELIVHLGRLRPGELHVVAPASVRRAQADGGDIGSIARRLDVSFVLAGTLRMEEDRLRVAARLVDARSESLLWTTSLERRLGSLLDVQQTLAARLSDALRRELLGDLSTGDGAHPAAEGVGVPGDALDAQAYEHFLRARHFLSQQTPAGFSSAEAELQRALEREPGFADAWAALATTRALIGIYDLERPRDVFPRAESALDRALELEPQNVDALVARARIDGAFHWRFDEAEATLRQVLESSPQHVEALRLLGQLLQARGRDPAAQEILARARRLDPLSLTLRSTIGWCHFLAGRTGVAIEHAKAVLELDSNYLVAWDDLKWFLTVAGRDTEAAEAFFKVVELEGDGDEVPELREIFADRGLRGLLEGSLESQLEHAAGPGYRSPYDIAINHAALGHVEDALEWLGRSFDEREVDLLGLAHDPRLDPLRSHPRFLSLLARLRPAPAVSLSSHEP